MLGSNGKVTLTPVFGEALRVKSDSDPGFTAIDHALMARALRLAGRGLYTTKPNPRVGCVIARGDEVVGEGWHQRAGEPHAETLALQVAGDRARGATAYVTLEPCAHFGKTPPCADALVAAGVARVVVAAEDTNPKAGGGLRRLREAGIAVEAGLLRDASRELNRGFFARFERGRPWVRVKLAMSLDGRTALANGESKWITGAAARADVARWRARSSAILAGAGTVRADDPRLTARLPDDVPCVPPLRVVLDARLDALTPQAHLLDGRAPTLVVHAPGARAQDDRHARAELVEAPRAAGGHGFDLPAVLHLLAERGVNELQVEAGPTLCGALLDQHLVDELLVYVAPTLLGDAARPLLRVAPLHALADRHDWRVCDRRMFGPDQRLLLRPAAL